eukprot:7597684-Alexandrium_andersonii.AAC.1
MSAILVGSEMCIRDSVLHGTVGLAAQHDVDALGVDLAHDLVLAHVEAVSYTHLTLPTICSV